MNTPASSTPESTPTRKRSLVMRILLSLIGLVTVAVVVVLILASRKPDEMRIERSVAIKAPPETIFPHLNSLKLMSDWSPWDKIDPKIQRTYDGADEGVGAHYAWSGNAEVGKGEMTVKESVPASMVKMDLHFIEPFEGRNTAEFTLKPEGENTTVTWAMYGPNTTLGKVIQVFCDMDAMIGDKFSEGLTTLKTKVETPK